MIERCCPPTVNGNAPIKSLTRVRVRRDIRSRQQRTISYDDIEAENGRAMMSSFGDWLWFYGGFDIGTIGVTLLQLEQPTRQPKGQTMTVAELIEKLKAFPLDMRVMTPGFDESGFDDLARVEEKLVVQASNKSGYAGNYEERAKFIEEDSELGTILRVVVVNW